MRNRIKKIISKESVNTMTKIGSWIIIVIGVWLIYEGYCSMYIMKRALIIMGLMVGYKWIGHKVGIIRGAIWVQRLKALSKGEEGEGQKFENKVEDFLWSKFMRRNEYLYEVIYWIFKIIPWNWGNAMLLWLWAKMYDIKMIMISNIEIYYKRKGIDKTGTNWTLKGRKYTYIYEWVIVYPILRLLLIPCRIRCKIFWYAEIKDLIKVRVIVFLYSSIYLYIGYSEYIGEINWVIKVVVIYIVIAIVWPIWIKIQKERGIDKEWDFYKPSKRDFVSISSQSVTKAIESKFLEDVHRVLNGKLHIKYNCYYDRNHNLLYTKKVGYLELMQKYSKSERLNECERIYGISALVYDSLCSSDWSGWNSRTMDWKYMELYLWGKRVLSKEEMKKYEISYKKLKEIYKCRQMFIMDLRRLIGIEEEKWMYKGREMSKFWDKEWENKDQILYKEVKENLYRIMPKEYMYDITLYNKILKYEAYLDWMLQYSIMEISYDLAYVEKDYLVYEVAKKEGYIKKVGKEYKMDGKMDGSKEEIEEFNIFLKGYKEFKREYVYLRDTREKRGLEEENYEIYEEWEKEIEKEYKKEYKEIKNKYSLISEKYILEYRDKYCLEKK